MTETLSVFCRSLRGFLSWRSLLPQDLNTLDMGERSLSCTRRPLSKRITLLGPSTFLRLPFRLVRHHFSSRRLMVWSNCLQELSPAHWWNLLVEKAEQKIAHCRGWSCVLLKRLWQGGQLAHSLLCGFGWSWPIGCPPFSLLRVFLHPFTLAFVIPVYLVGDDLRVAMNNHACGPCCFGEIKSFH